MKFEAQAYKPIGTESTEMSRFLTHYNFVVKFLTEFNLKGFRLVDDVRLSVSDVTLVHRQPSIIRHSMGLSRNLILQGRVEMHTIQGASDGRITVVPKLLTTSIIDPVFNRLTNKITVADSALFQTGDKILIGSSYRTIANISANEFTLDENVLYDKVYVVSLATETVKAIVF